MSGAELVGEAVGHPLAGLAATVAVYAGAVKLHRVCGRPAVLTPVFVSIPSMILLLTLLGIPYAHYFASAGILHAMLPAAFALLTVAVWRQCRVIGRHFAIVLSVVALGALVAVATALLPPLLLHNPLSALATLSVRSITTPIAIPLAESFGGIASLAAFVVIASAVIGAKFGPSVLRVCGVRDDRAIGLALGVSSHAIGTAQAIRISERAGAFAVVGMVATTILASLVVFLALGGI